MDALKVSPHGQTIILKRNPCDTYINPCNLDILHLWGGNVDLQHVIDKIATIMYVCSYMTVTSTVFESKDEPTQMTKQSFTIMYFITYKKTIHFKLICKNVHS